MQNQGCGGVGLGFHFYLAGTSVSKLRSPKREMKAILFLLRLPAAFPYIGDQYPGNYRSRRLRSNVGKRRGTEVTEKEWSSRTI